MTVDYLFTTFPELSETFYQREIRALTSLGVEVHIHSLWGGTDRFEGLAVRRFNKWRLAGLVWWIPYWACRRPRAAAAVLGRLSGSLPPSRLNLLENLLGLGFALVHAREFGSTASTASAGEARAIHAAWATAPGAAAQFIGELTGRVFCQGAHAYDVFRDGGDWWLESKLWAAAAVVTSTEATARALRERGVEERRLHVIRRGLDTLPAPTPPRPDREPVRLLSVGRLIEKKGYLAQLDIYAALARAGIRFEARMVGEGPMREQLAARIDELGLIGDVTLVGALPYDQMSSLYGWADVFLFTGIVAASGDRDGLPNVIPEAMAAGVPVIASPVGGAPEAVSDAVTGFLLEPCDTEAWVNRIRQLVSDDALYSAVGRRAREWVEREFDARRNGAHLVEVWRGITGAERR